MAALTGTFERTVDFYPGSGTINQMSGVVANSGETMAYLCDKARGSLWSLNLSTWAKSEILTGFTSPVAIAISNDNATLYVLTDAGLLFSVPVSSPAATQIATLNSVATNGWAYMVMNQAGTHLYILGNNKSVYKLTLSDNSYSAWRTFAYWGNGLAFNADFSSLYKFIAIGGPISSGPLTKIIMSQERTEVVAGTSTSADNNGEAFLVASFATPGDIAVDSNGDVYCGSSAGASAKIRKISGGTVSTLYAASSIVSANTRPHLYVLRTARKLLVTNGSTGLNVIT